MRVFLDGRLIDDAGSTLERAIDAARRHAGGRMIVQALADGAPVPAGDLDSPPPATPYAATIEFASADAEEVVSRTLHDAADLLEGIKERQSEAAGMLQRGEIELAVRSVSEVLQSWGSVRDVLALVVQAPSPGCYDAPSREELFQAVESLASGLGEVKRAMGVQDWSGLADSLAWDMREQAERLRSWLVRAAGDR